MKLGRLAEMQVEAIKQQQRGLKEKMELVLLRDLVSKLDPEHDYTFDAQKMEFTKTERSDEGDKQPVSTGMPEGLEAPVEEN